MATEYNMSTQAIKKTPNADFMDVRATMRRNTDTNFGDYMDQAIGQIEPQPRRNPQPSESVNRNEKRSDTPEPQPPDKAAKSDQTENANSDNTVDENTPVSETAPVETSESTGEPGEDASNETTAETGGTSDGENVSDVESDQAENSVVIIVTADLAARTDGREDQPQPVQQTASARPDEVLGMNENSQTVIQSDKVNATPVMTVETNPAQAAVSDKPAQTGSDTTRAQRGDTEVRTTAQHQNPLVESSTEQAGAQQPQTQSNNENRTTADNLLEPVQSQEKTDVSQEPAESEAQTVEHRIPSKKEQLADNREIEDPRMSLADRKKQMILDEGRNLPANTRMANSEMAVDQTVKIAVQTGPERNIQTSETEAVVNPGVKADSTETIALPKTLAVEKPAAEAVDLTRNVEEIVKSVRTMIGRNQSVVQMRLDPPELGALRIEIKMDANGLNLQMQTGNVRTQQLLQQNAQELKAALEASGIQTGQIDIQLKLDLKNSDTQGRSDNPSQFNQQNNRQDANGFQQEFHSSYRQDYNLAGFDDDFWEEDFPAIETTIPADVSTEVASRTDRFREWQYSSLNVVV